MSHTQPGYRAAGGPCDPGLGEPPMYTQSLRALGEQHAGGEALDEEFLDGLWRQVRLPVFFTLSSADLGPCGQSCRLPNCT